MWTELTPILQKFENDMFKFKIERQQHMEILLRYDEVISEKASKFQIAELREDLYRNFTKKEYSEDLNEKLA